VLADLREWGVDIVTIGQYLKPSPGHLPIERYAPLEEFAELKQFGMDMGFRWVESGPLVRSSYRAGEQVRALGIAHRHPRRSDQMRTPEGTRPLIIPGGEPR